MYNSNSNSNNSNDASNNNSSNTNRTTGGSVMEPEQFRKVFIGGLSYKTDDETLKNYFSKYGNLVDYVVMKDPSTSRSRGFGFVTYSESYMVDELMKNRPHIIDGRQVEPKRATPREDSGKAEIQMTVKKLFIGGLRETITEDDLRNYFGQYGNILETIVMKEKESGKSRGFGFVTFDDYDPIDKIILEKHHTINGINVHVQKALPKDFDKGPGKISQQGYGSRGGNSGYGSGGGRNYNNYDNNNDNGYYDNNQSSNYSSQPYPPIPDQNPGNINNLAQMAASFFAAAAANKGGMSSSSSSNMMGSMKHEMQNTGGYENFGYSSAGMSSDSGMGGMGHLMGQMMNSRSNMGQQMGGSGMSTAGSKLSSGGGGPGPMRGGARYTSRSSGPYGGGNAGGGSFGRGGRGGRGGNASRGRGQ